MLLLFLLYCPEVMMCVFPEPLTVGKIKMMETNQGGILVLTVGWVGAGFGGPSHDLAHSQKTLVSWSKVIVSTLGLF